jgi:hypothetical protein
VIEEKKTHCSVVDLIPIVMGRNGRLINTLELHIARCFSASPPLNLPKQFQSNEIVQKVDRPHQAIQSFPDFARLYSWLVGWLVGVHLPPGAMVGRDLPKGIGTC